MSADGPLTITHIIAVINGWSGKTGEERPVRAHGKHTVSVSAEGIRILTVKSFAGIVIKELSEKLF